MPRTTKNIVSRHDEPTLDAAQTWIAAQLRDVDDAAYVEVRLGRNPLIPAQDWPQGPIWNAEVVRSYEEGRPEE